MLDIDACDKQVGINIWQEQPEGAEKPMEFWSQSLKRSEKS